jgi:hypothetical protein
VSREFRVECRDGNDQPKAAGADRTIRLESTSGGGRFAAVSPPSGWSVSNSHSLVLSAGQSAVSFLYRDSLAGTPRIVASEYPSLGWTDASQTATVGRRFLAFVSLPASAFRDEPSGVIIVRTVDAGGTPVPVGADTTLDFVSSSPSGTFSLQADPFVPVASTLLPEGQSEIRFYYRDTEAGTHTLSVRESPSRNWGYEERTIRILPPTDHFDVEAPGTVVSGEPFVVLISAKTAENAILSSYTGSVDLETLYVDPPSGASLLQIENEPVFTEGVASVEAVYPDCGTFRIRATDRSDDSFFGVSNDILAVPHHFDVEIPPEQAVLKPAEIRVTARNAAGESTPGFERDALLEAVFVFPDVSDGFLSPGTIPFQNGEGTLSNLVYNRWGSVNIRVRDPRNPLPAVESTSDTVFFHPHAVSLAVSDPPPRRDFFYLEERIRIEARILDFQGGLLSDYRGTVSFDALEGAKLPPDYSFVSEDGGVHVFDVFLLDPGEYSVTLRDSRYAPAFSKTDPISARYAEIVVQSKTVQLGETRVWLKIVDEDGQPITLDDSTQVVLNFVESDPDGTATLLPRNEPVRVRSGVGHFSVRDTEPEDITVFPLSVPELPWESGTIRFVSSYREMGEGGIRILFWKEQRE